MTMTELLGAWKSILSGGHPSLSIEITRECPLRCPGCYAYEDAHLGGGTTLRQLVDRTGKELVDSVLALVDSYQPLHLSIVGGDPLVRYRELDTLLPLLSQRGIHVQVVTSAFRSLSPGWARLPKLNIVVSIDGLQPEHDARRKPATYSRILENIQGQRVTVHCTITGQMMKRARYLEEFLAFWSPREEVKKIWMSMFTPQLGDHSPECLSREQRRAAIEDLLALREQYPKLDMPEPLIREFLMPPQSPAECIFAQTTYSLSADFQTRIVPCQFGGMPDCSQCGCVASMGLAAIGHHKLAGVVPVGQVFRASIRAGQIMASMRTRGSTSCSQDFHILAN
ncbi:MAG TPA: radical SAM protein [Bryobacteraceae bacterium]|nr:radical SAM protein [Bryobacteraceae bacterium]